MAGVNFVAKRVVKYGSDDFVSPAQTPLELIKMAIGISASPKPS
jgi:hypothetical protein